jgi:hypothetical protein
LGAPALLSASGKHKRESQRQKRCRTKQTFHLMFLQKNIYTGIRLYFTVFYAPSQARFSLFCGRILSLAETIPKVVGLSCPGGTRRLGQKSVDELCRNLVDNVFDRKIKGHREPPKRIELCILKYVRNKPDKKKNPARRRRGSGARRTRTRRVYEESK